MPTSYPSKNKAECWGRRKQDGSRSSYTLVTSPHQLLSNITTNDGVKPSASPEPRIVQSSFEDLDRTSTVFAAKNGFVYSVLEAYNEHHNLVLRPDDVWIAILTQLSCYINANAEMLRPRLFRDAGEVGYVESLHIDIDLASPGLDHGKVATQMTELIGERLVEARVRNLILPNFTTTEKTDEAVASIVFMGAMQKYFSYSWGTRCGIPAVTLLGTPADWHEIFTRAEALLGDGFFGAGPKRWFQDVLSKVLCGFVNTALTPASTWALDFWQRVVDGHEPNGSGQVAYSGWITAFCYWNEKGECLHPVKSELGIGSAGINGGFGGPMLALNEIPMGFSKVPVTLIDNGEEKSTEMVAGSVAMRVRKFGEGVEQATAPAPSCPLRSGSTAEQSRGKTHRGRWDGYDTLQPVTGWFMHVP